MTGEPPPVDRLRRSLLRALTGALGWGFGARPPRPGAGPPRGWIAADPPAPAHPPRILVALPDLAPFRVVHRSLLEELEPDFALTTLAFAGPPEVAALVRALEGERFAAVVVMDDPVLSLYRRYADSRPAERPAPPAVAVMTSFLGDLGHLANTTGIAYEVPGVTALVQLRSVIARPVHRVAVPCRRRFLGFLEQQQRLAAREQIALVPFVVGDDPGAAEVRAALRAARDTPQLDALWVLGDSGLLRDAEFLEVAWRPELAQLDLPVVVGVTSLAAGAARFGSFAVVPDHEALGVQCAHLIFELAQTGWRAGDHPVEPPISTVTVANLARLGERYGLRPGAGERVDEVVE